MNTDLKCQHTFLGYGALPGVVPTQFFSVDFSKSRIGVKSAFSTNPQFGMHQLFLHQSLSSGVLEPAASATHPTVYDSFSVVPEEAHESSRGPLKGTVSAQKVLQGSEMETMELLGGTEEYSVCPPGKSMIFHKKETEKN